MGILTYIAESNQKAFNNMLRHSQQGGQEVVFNKRVSKLTPVVQAVKTGAFWAFISSDFHYRVVYHNESGSTVASQEKAIVSMLARYQRNLKNA